MMNIAAECVCCQDVDIIKAKCDWEEGTEMFNLTSRVLIGLLGCFGAAGCS